MSPNMTANTEPLDKSTLSHAAKCKLVASSKHLRVTATPFNKPSSLANNTQADNRETTPPHAFNNNTNSQGVPSSPATPISSTCYLSNRTVPSSLLSETTDSESFGSSTSDSINTSCSFRSTNQGFFSSLDKNKGINPALNRQKPSASSDVDMLQHEPTSLGDDDDCIMKDSHSSDDDDDDLYASIPSNALFNTKNNKNTIDNFTKARNIKNNFISLKNPLASTGPHSLSLKDTVDGSMPSTPSSAFFHTSQYHPHSGNFNAGTGNINYSQNSRRNINSSAASRAGGNPAANDQPFPLPVHKVLDSIFPHISHYTDDDKITLLKGILSLTTRPVLSAIQEHISPLLKKDPFAYLPSEISLRIISFIDDPKTLARASQVSRLWYLILSDDLTWKELCKTHHYRVLSSAVGTASNGSQSQTENETDKAIEVAGSTTFANNDTVSNNNSGFLSSAGYGPNPETNNAIATGLNDFVDSQYYPESMKQPAPTNYRSYFKHQYMLNSAWQSGGSLAAKYVINHSGVVTSLIMTSKYIAFSLDSSKIFVFSEDGKLLRSLLGHTMGVWALNIWGDTLVSGGCDRDIRVWNLKTGECLQILRGHQSTIRCIQMVDAKTIISGSRDTSVRIWDIEKGICLHVLNGHTSTVRCIEIKGDICVSGSYDCTARIWRISDGTLLNILYGHISQIYSLAFDGDRIVTGSLDAIIKVWDAQTGADLGVLSGHTSLVSLLQLKGDTLASGGSDGTVRIWDLNDFKCVHRLAAHDNSVTSLQFDDYRIVSGGSDGRVKVWDRESGLLVRELSSPYNSVWRIEFKDEKLAILASRNQQVHFKLISFCPQKDSCDRKTQENAKRRLDSLIDNTEQDIIRSNIRSDTINDNEHAVVDESIILGSETSNSLLRPNAFSVGGDLERPYDSLPVNNVTRAGNNDGDNHHDSDASDIGSQSFASPILPAMAGPIPSHNGSRTVSRDASRRSSFASLNSVFAMAGGGLSLLQTTGREANNLLSNTHSNTDGNSRDVNLTVSVAEPQGSGNGLNSPISMMTFVPRASNAHSSTAFRASNRNDNATLGELNSDSTPTSLQASRSTSRLLVLPTHSNNDTSSALPSSVSLSFDNEDGTSAPTPSTLSSSSVLTRVSSLSNPSFQNNDTSSTDQNSTNEHKFMSAVDSSSHDSNTFATTAINATSLTSTPTSNITSTPTNPPPHNVGNIFGSR